MEQNNRPLRILVLTLAPWNYKNCTGSTQSSIFEGMENIEVANIYCRYGEPDNAIVSRYFQITEKSMLNHLLKHTPSGYERKFDKTKQSETNIDILNDGENKLFNWMRILRFQIFYWAQEIFWKLNLWKSPELTAFVKDFNPDIVWSPIYYTCYTNNLALYLKKITGKNLVCYISDDNYTMHQFSLSPFYWIDRPIYYTCYTNNLALYLKKITGKNLVCYISDDNYTMHQFSLSPFYWIDRLIKRPKIKKVIQSCSQLYVITEQQKNEYDKIFNISSKVLTKGATFKEQFPPVKVHNPIKLVFMGSLGFNRWKSLAKIAQALHQLSKHGISCFLSIYTMTPLTDKIKSKIEIDGVSKLQPTISNAQIDPTFQDNDILIHVEPTDLKNTLYYRLSFSTKLVDYFRNGRCIIAYGGNTGSMKYLKDNDCGIVISPKDDLVKELATILSVDYFRNGRCIIAYGGNTGSMKYLKDNDCGIVISPKDDLVKELATILSDTTLIEDYAHKSYEIGRKNHQIKIIQSNLKKDLEHFAKS